MTRAARLSETEFNPDSHRFDLSAHAERLDEQSGSADEELDFTGQPQSTTSKIRRILKESRFN